MNKKVSDSYKRHWLSMVIGPSLKLIEAVFDLLIPLFMKAVIDLAKFIEPSAIPNKISRSLAYFLRMMFLFSSNNQPLSDSLNALILILAMGFVGFGLTMISQYLAARSAISVGYEVRDSLYQKTLQLSKKEREKIGNNKLLTILNSDVYQVQQGVLIFVRLIVRAPFIIIGALTISFLLEWRIGIVFASIVPLILIVIFVLMRKSSKEYVTIQSKLDDISVKTSDTISGIKVIKALNKQEYENESFKKKTDSYHRHAVKVNKINSLINPLTFAIISAATILVVFIGGKSIIASSSSDGLLLATTIIAETSYLAQILFTLIQLANVVLILTKAKVSRKRCDEILSIKPSIHNSKDAVAMLTADGTSLIKFEDVSFGYEEGGNNALSNISFEMKKGESLGLIGGTGSGKSTLISLIERFLDVTKGEIKYKDVNIKDYDLGSLRSEIALVPQKSTLFKGTIRSNMLMAKSDATDKDIVAALKMAEAYEFVSKYDDFLEHEVVEEGKNFSGGQRQRLCIVRAILKNPEIIILDDSTSALDYLTDRKVRDNISSIKGISKIIVSQRVSTVSSCDQILVFENGELVAKGNHEYLLKHSPIYLETFESQSKKEAK